MKYIKQITTIIIFGIFLINIQSTQAQIMNPPEIGNVTIEIPEKLKSSQIMAESNDAVNSIHSKFSIIHNGYINVTLDNNGKVVTITTPNNVDRLILVNNQNKGVVPCPHCIPYSENISCLLACIFDTIFNQWLCGC